jgi:hypothetical protein
MEMVKETEREREREREKRRGKTTPGGGRNAAETAGTGESSACRGCLTAS